MQITYDKRQPPYKLTVTFLLTLVAVAIVVGLNTGCTSASVKPAPETPVKVETESPGPSAPVSEGKIGEAPLLAWGESKANWSEHLLKEIKAYKIKEASDIKFWCPAYKGDKDLVYAQIISRMAYFESGFKPTSVYQENFKSSSTGTYVQSTGLMQLSVSSSNQERYSCHTIDQDHLKDPLHNLSCAVKIFGYWVNTDGKMAGKWNDYKGAGRYWSVMRETKCDSKLLNCKARDSFKGIKTYMAKLEVCK